MYSLFLPSQNSLYLNDEVKIIESDITRENGVIHFIDGILAPYDLQHHNISCNLSQVCLTLRYTRKGERSPNEFASLEATIKLDVIENNHGF